MDFPAAVFPVTVVDPLLDVKVPRTEFFSEADKDIYNMCMAFQIALYPEIDAWRVDDPELVKGLPATLQIVGRTLDDEAVLGMLGMVDRALKRSDVGVRTKSKY